MQRRVRGELMDQPGVDPGELGRALGYLRWVNRRLGGTRALVGRLERWSRSWPRGQTITLLDVGTGSADIPLAAVRWAASRGLDLRATGIDNHEGTLSHARRQVGAEQRVTLVRCDATSIVERFGPKSFDYVHAGLFLHHLPEIEVLTVLAQMDRVARRGIVWSDLVRSPLQRALVRIATVGGGRLVRHDAVASVEAGFTKREVLDIAKRLDLWYCTYHRAPGWYRFVLSGERD
jgi:hypothetical protein